jgi:hypothetical protein
MKALGEQLREIIQRKAQGLEAVARPIAADIESKMKDNTLRGSGFGSDEYINDYSENYAIRAKGGNRSPVTLRASRRRIEQTNVDPIQGGARIRFADDEGGRIFRYHHEGTAKGGKTRSIFPKSVQSVPLETRAIAQAQVHEVLK